MSDTIKNGYNKVVSFAKEKPLICSLICIGILAIIIIIIAIAASTGKSKKKDICENQYSDECLYSKIIKNQDNYPEGMSWDNNNCYFSHSLNNETYGSTAFAFLLSDVLFGNLEAKDLKSCNYFKVGDVVSIEDKNHFAVVIKVDRKKNIITIAEGDYSGEVHYGRRFKASELETICDFIIRRNPN